MWSHWKFSYTGESGKQFQGRTFYSPDPLKQSISGQPSVVICLAFQERLTPIAFVTSAFLLYLPNLRLSFRSSVPPNASTCAGYRKTRLFLCNQLNDALQEGILHKVYLREKYFCISWTVPSVYTLWKNALFTIAELLFIYIIFFNHFNSYERSPEGKTVPTFVLFTMALEKAVYLKLSSRAHQSRKVEVTWKNSHHRQLMYNSCIDTADVLYKVIN